MSQSELEDRFVFLWRQLAATQPQPEREVRFHPKRKWRFDFAWPAYRVAVEIQGGIFARGGHFRPMQYQEDCIKHNAAVSLGWRLLWYTPKDLDRHPNAIVRQIRGFLDKGEVTEGQRRLFA